MKKTRLLRKVMAISVISLLLWASILGQVSIDSQGEAKGNISVLSERLPFPRLGTSAIWDGENAYIFGGVVDENGSYPLSAKTVGDILKFNPKEEKLRIMDTTMPGNRSTTSAVWSGKYVYVLGGEFIDPILRRKLYDDIVMYSIQNDSSWTIPFLTLPVKNYAAPSIYDGKNIFLFGGSGESAQKGIVQFNTTIYYAVYLPVDLPTYISYSSAIWDGESAFIFGGTGSDDNYDYTRVIRFTPYKNTVTTMKAKLPGKRIRTSAVWDGKYAYIFGGGYWDGEKWTVSDNILRYDPESDKIDVMPSRLPTAREGTSAIWTGSSAYIFGGFLGEDNLTDEIVKYTPPKGVADSDDGEDTGAMIVAGSIVILLVIAVVVYVVLRRRY